MVEESIKLEELKAKRNFILTLRVNVDFI